MKTSEAKRKYDKEYRKTHREQAKQGQKRYRVKLKRLVLSHYSSSHPVCLHCGVDDIDVLTIDHINGGGHKHRVSLHSEFYKWLKTNNFPKGYQVLCWNCNFKKRMCRINEEAKNV